MTFRAKIGLRPTTSLITENESWCPMVILRSLSAAYFTMMPSASRLYIQHGHAIGVYYGFFHKVLRAMGANSTDEKVCFVSALVYTAPNFPVPFTRAGRTGILRPGKTVSHETFPLQPSVNQKTAHHHTASNAKKPNAAISRAGSIARFERRACSGVGLIA